MSFLTARLNRLQAKTRDEFESSGLDKVYKDKLNAAAAVYAEDQAARKASSSGYQSNDSSAPEEAPEELKHDVHVELMYSKVSENLRAMAVFDDVDRPWHEDVDEVSEEPVSHPNTPIRDQQYLNHDVQNDKCIRLDLQNDEQPAPVVSSGRPLWQRPSSSSVVENTPKPSPSPSLYQNEWQRSDSRLSQTPQMSSQNEYRLFAVPPTQTISVQNQDPFPRVAEEPSSHHRQRQWQNPAKQITTETIPFPYQNAGEFDTFVERPSNSANQNQWMPSAYAEHLYEHPRALGLVSRTPRMQHSDGQRSPQIYFDVEHERTSLRHEMPGWLNADGAHYVDDVPPEAQPAQQYLSPSSMVSVANALSNTLNVTPQTNLAAEYFLSTPSAGYDNVNVSSKSFESASEFNNCLLKIAEASMPVPSAPLLCKLNDSTSNVERYSPNCVVTHAPKQQQQQQHQMQSQTFLLHEPPSLTKIDVSKPPPPLPTHCSNSDPANAFIQNCAITEVTYAHETDVRHVQQLSLSPPVESVRCEMRYDRSSPMPQVQQLSANKRDSRFEQEMPYIQLLGYAEVFQPETIYGDVPRSEMRYACVRRPPSPSQGVTADTLYSQMALQHQQTPETSYIQLPEIRRIQTSETNYIRTPFNSDVTIEQFARQQTSNPEFETTIDEFTRQPPVASPTLPVIPKVGYTQTGGSTNQTGRFSECELRSTSTSSTSDKPASARAIPTNSSRSSTMTNGMGGVSQGGFSGGSGGHRTPREQRIQQRHSDSGGSAGRFINENGGYESGGPGSGGRSQKYQRASNTVEEERQLGERLTDSYGYTLDQLLHRCFSKSESFSATVSLNSTRHPRGDRDVFTHARWNEECCGELTSLKQRLNSVKERLSSYELNEWHRHTRTTNPADMVMRRLRTDTKVEFLTQAWCKFYELVDTFNLIPRDARRRNELRSVHLCEAPGAFVASLNHYLRLNHPDIKWYWKANSLNPYYEGNHLSSMINDDRFMLQTIHNWDFGPDMTGDIMHPGYPDHLRAVCGQHLPHLVTADGSFDCQDKPEEQERSVAWLHLKEALTAIRILRQGGHFVIKMFTIFECESVCLLFLLQCVFQSVDIFKPATSKEGNSEVYVICREFKDNSVFEPFITRLLSIDEETHSKFAMFPFERIPRTFLRSVVNCASRFAALQTEVIERNIRLYQHERYNEFRQHFEFVQEKLFERYVEKYRIKPIPLSETVVRMPQRRQEKRFMLPKVMEQREHKQGSHADQLKRSSLTTKDLVKVVMEEVADFPQHRHSRVSTVPKVDIRPDDVRIRCGKPIETVTSSQFCHGMLIRVRNELMKVMGPAQYYIHVSEVEKSVEFEDRKEQIQQKYPNLCDFTRSLALTKKYNDKQRELFKMLFDRLTVLEEHENFTMFSFPLLTQFNISVLSVLNQIFKEIRFEPPNTLYLCDLNSKHFNLWMPVLKDIGRTYDKEGAIISFLPIESITGTNNPFYSWVIEANNAQILREIHLISEHQS